MKTWLKVLLGIGAGLLLLVVIGAVLLIQSSHWKEIRGFSGGMMDLTRSAKAMERLDKQQSYQEPADGRIPEARLVAYMEMCEALKPVESPYSAWMEAHGGKKGEFKDAAEAITLMSRLMDTTAQQLAEHRMSAREFTWLHTAVRKARKEASEKAGSPMALELLETLKRMSKAPGLEPPMRRELEQKISHYEQWLEKGKGPLSFNAKLCLAHAERLGAAELGDGGDIILGGMKKGTRP